MSAIAAVGASVAFVPCNATVIRWFTRRRGLAIGLASCGISAAAALGPPIAGWLILEIGWRHALYVMALCGGVAVLLAAQGMVRDPESRGLRPDGDDAEAFGRLEPRAVGQVHDTVVERARERRPEDSAV